MANVFSVAKYILESYPNGLTAMKLQKFVYYAQAWNLVWDEKPLFDSKLEAWRNGPVCPDLYFWHQGKFIVTPDEMLELKAKGHELDTDEKETIDQVLLGYGEFTAQELSELTHKEDPWKSANRTCTDPENCQAEITQDAMYYYYNGIRPE